MRRDFDCLLSPEDCLGARPFGTALGVVVGRLKIFDAWTNTVGRNAFTHYRLQRAHASTGYVSQTNLVESRCRNASGCFHGPHLAVCLRIKLEVKMRHCRRELWKVNSKLSDNEQRCLRLSSELIGRE